MTPSKCNLIGILPTSFDKREPEQLAQLQNLVDVYGSLVWPVVPVAAHCKIANRLGKTIYEHNPKSRALLGYKEGRKMIGGYNVALAKLLEYLE
jgi:cellulose biosynthesis protein BcsQ